MLFSQIGGELDPNAAARQLDGLWPTMEPYLPYLVGGAVALVALVLLLRMFSGRGSGPASQPAGKIELQRLPTAGPPATGPRVELYNVPMRLAVVVVAPLGRGGQAPTQSQIPGIVEAAVPGIKHVVAAHQPLLRIMPPQLSAKGFAHVVFAKLQLPGIDAEGETDAQGKGTPWSMVAGKIDVGGRKLLAAMVLRADKPNGVGGVMLENENQWLDVVKIRDAS